MFPVKIYIRLAFLIHLLAAPSLAQDVTWRNILDQPEDWYGSEQAVGTARRVLAAQLDNGGWNKNFDYTRRYTDSELADYRRAHGSAATIDNGATTTEMIFLARVYRHTRAPRLRKAFMRGLNYLLEAQYPNGGWPQYYPAGGADYSVHITYNDDAMINVMRLLRSVAEGKPPCGFVDDNRRRAASAAVDRGVACILATQIEVDGRLTAWCAQHDKDTLAPTGARSYELPSISGQESVRIVRFLMDIDNPEQRVIRAVRSAVRWFDRVRITGIEEQIIYDEAGRRIDKAIIENPDAGPIWARFYEIGTNRPIFCGRDGAVKYTLAEVEQERRVGYAWYTHRARDLLDDDYPKWRAKWAPDADVPAR